MSTPSETEQKKQSEPPILRFPDTNFASQLKSLSKTSLDKPSVALSTSHATTRMLCLVAICEKLVEAHGYHQAELDAYKAKEIQSGHHLAMLEGELQRVTKECLEMKEVFGAVRNELKIIKDRAAKLEGVELLENMISKAAMVERWEAAGIWAGALSRRS